ncbi:unnamed protein product [Sympodiomycopsis kandeliae]
MASSTSFVGASYSSAPSSGDVVDPLSSSNSSDRHHQQQRHSVAHDNAVFLTTVVTDFAYLNPTTYDCLLAETLNLQANPGALVAFEARRSQACALISAVGARLGLPTRTVNTAFVVWQKCGVQLGASSSTTGQQVALAAILVACKLNDTIKKAREVIIGSYAIRYPELVKSIPFSSATTLYDLSLATVSESDVDSQLLEAERTKVLNLEKTMLESIGYDFKIRQTVESVGRAVLKLGKAWGAHKSFVRAAWQISSDIHQVPAALVYPPQVLSLAGLLLAALLYDEESDPSVTTFTSASGAALRNSAQIILGVFGLSNGSAERLFAPGYPSSDFGTKSNQGQSLPAQAAEWTEPDQWETQLKVYREEVEDTVHATLDMYLSAASTLVSQRASRPGNAPSSSPFSTSPLTPTSPASPSEPSAASRNANGGIIKFSQLPSHVFSPPPLGVSEWLRARTQTESSDPTSRNADASAGQPSSRSLLSEFSQRLTESKIMLRHAEDRRKTAENPRTENGRMLGTDRAQKRQRIEDAKNSIQILRYSVHGDEEDTTDKPQSGSSDHPGPNSNRSTVVDKSETTVLLGIRQAQASIAEDIETSAQPGFSSNSAAAAPSTGPKVDSAIPQRGSTGATSSLSSAAPTPTVIPPMTTGSTSSLSDSTPRIGHDRIREGSIVSALPTSNGAGATAAAAVKAGKAVKTTRFLF